MNPREKSPRRRPRVSMLSLLLLTTTAALAVGLYQARESNIRILARVGPLEEENRRLRAEQGALTVDDPKKVYAIRMPKLFDDVWQYRVYLPPGQEYYVAAQVNHLPQGEEIQRIRFGDRHPPGTSTLGTGSSPLGAEQVGQGEKPGEIVVTLRLFTNEEGEKAISFSSGHPGRQGSSSFAIRSDADEWPAIEKTERTPGDPPRFTSAGGVSEGQQVERDPKRLPLVLLDYRVMHSGVTSSADSDEGVLVWVGRADEHLQSDR